MKLNGWLRLWVLLTILWLIPVNAISIDAFIDSNNYYKSAWDTADVELSYFNQFKKEPDISGVTWDSDPIPIEEVKKRWRKLAKIYKGNPVFEKIERDNLERINNRYESRKSVVYWWTGLSLIPPLLILLLGYGVAWVRKGFKGDKS